MKKIVFSLLLSSVLFGADVTGALRAKILPSENKGYYVFADGSFWKVTTLVKRWRGPLEWLRGDELYVPESYVTTLEDWSFGDEFEVYPKLGNLRLDESVASNEKELQSYTHLLVNPFTGKVIFGIPLHPADFVNQLYNDGYDIGYSKGESVGYTNGYSVGYNFGYSDGRRSAGGH
jgi:hypothetical protein